MPGHTPRLRHPSLATPLYSALFIFEEIVYSIFISSNLSFNLPYPLASRRGAGGTEVGVTVGTHNGMDIASENLISKVKSKVPLSRMGILWC